MIWIPDLSTVLQVFDLLKTLPECNDLLKAVCINPNGIKGVLDKVEFGLPFQNISFWEKSAILINDIISFHYFSDGNKRIGFIMLILFLKKNGYVLTATEDEKVEFTLSIAKGVLQNENIADWISKHIISS